MHRPSRETMAALFIAAASRLPATSQHALGGSPPHYDHVEERHHARLNALGARHASRRSWDICHRLYATAGTPEPPASVMQTIHVPGSGHLSSLN